MMLTLTNPTRRRPPLHPGAVIADALGDDPSMSVVGERLRMPQQRLLEVLQCRAPVTPEIALRIGRLLGNGPDLWLALQAKYDLWNEGNWPG
jgi:addiction module HigA family antidote